MPLEVAIQVALIVEPGFQRNARRRHAFAQHELCALDATPQDVALWRLAGEGSKHRRKAPDAESAQCCELGQGQLVAEVYFDEIDHTLERQARMRRRPGAIPRKRAAFRPRLSEAIRRRCRCHLIRRSPVVVLDEQGVFVKRPPC